MVPLDKKSTADEIRKRFDGDVERFSNLDTGQQAAIDAPLMLELISDVAARVKPEATHLLDIGCGAGNNAIKIGQQISGLNFDLVDLSVPMLDRARDRLNREKSGEVRTFAGDFRGIDLPESHYDIIVAAAVLHHLREDADWEQTFSKIHRLLKPGGILLVSDLVIHGNDKIHEIMWQRYGDYLISVGGESYRDEVFEYIDFEDSPRSLTYQLDLCRQVGFASVDILHKHSCFGAYIAMKT